MLSVWQGHTTFQPITYSTESFIDVDLRFTPGNASTKALLAPLKKTVLWLVHNQVTPTPSETKPTHWPRDDSCS